MLKVSILLAFCACSVSSLDMDNFKGSYKSLQDFKNSPWVVKTVDANEPNPRAKFTGVNFMLAQDIAHNAKEYRVFYEGVVGMETVMRRSEENDLYYRQVTDGKKLLKLVYNGRQGLVDCDVLREKEDVDRFLSEFLLKDPNSVIPVRRGRKAIDVSAHIKNAESRIQNGTYQVLENRRVLADPFATIADLAALQSECVQLHHRIKHRLRALGRHVDLFERVANGGGKHEELPQLIPRREKRLKKKQGRSRQRRDALLMPDTKWCGAGSATEDFEDMGESRETDRCCREHDHCPYFIEGFSTNYNMFNYYFHTVSHCYCDEIFRTCLRTASSDKAEMVGNVYFDILGMRCFEFETEQVCVERNFWGSCIRHEEQPVAKIRGSLNWD